MCIARGSSADTGPSFPGNPQPALAASDECDGLFVPTGGAHIQAGPTAGYRAAAVSRLIVFKVIFV